MAYSKFNAKPTHVDGIRFASKREAQRFSELKNLERAGIITHLELQPRFPLIVGGKVVCTYIGDFRYLENGKSVTEDVKGFKTGEYIIKRKLLMALNPALDHREIGIQKKRTGKRDVTAEVAEIFREAGRRRA